MNLFKRNGVYYIDFKDPLTGKRKSKSTGEEMKSAAKKFLMKFVMEYNERKDLDYIPISLCKAVWEYRKYCESYHSEKTRLDLKGTFKRFETFIGDVQLIHVTQIKIQDFLQKRFAVSAYTADKDLRYIKTFFKYAVEHNYLVNNPCSKIKRFKLPQKQPLFFSEAEFNKLLSVIDSKHFRDLISFAVFSGLRRGELINLHWSQVSFKDRLIILDNHNHKTKSGKIRTIPLCIKALQILTERNLNSKSDIVFTNEKGEKYKNDYATKKLKKAVYDAKLNPAYHFHHLRHTAASWLVKAGASLYEVQHILGHSTSKITEIYAHLRADTLINAMQRLDSLDININYSVEPCIISDEGRNEPISDI